MLIWYKLGAVALVLVSLWWYWSWSTDKIAELNKALVTEQLVSSTQAETIKDLEDSKENQDIALLDLLETNKTINKDVKKYLAIFKKHPFTKLSLFKPDTIERQANAETKRLFKELEDETTINNPTE